MKKRLLLLVLSVLSGAQMQAGSWFESLRNYSPYQWGSVKRYAPENVASRLATMRYLYGNDVAQDQEQLRSDYFWYLGNKLDNELNRRIYLQNLFLQAKYPKLYSDVAEKSAAVKKLSSSAAESLQDQIDSSQNKWQRLFDIRHTLIRPAIKETEAEMLRPNTYYQYQHPDEYILNY